MLPSPSSKPQALVPTVCEAATKAHGLLRGFGVAELHWAVDALGSVGESGLYEPASLSQTQARQLPAVHLGFLTENRAQSSSTSRPTVTQSRLPLAGLAPELIGGPGPSDQGFAADSAELNVLVTYSCLVAAQRGAVR